MDDRNHGLARAHVHVRDLHAPSRDLDRDLVQDPKGDIAKAEADRLRENDQAVAAAAGHLVAAAAVAEAGVATEDAEDTSIAEAEDTEAAVTVAAVAEALMADGEQGRESKRESRVIGIVQGATNTTLLREQSVECVTNPNLEEVHQPCQHPNRHMRLHLLLTHKRFLLTLGTPQLA